MTACDLKKQLAMGQNFRGISNSFTLAWAKLAW